MRQKQIKGIIITAALFLGGIITSYIGFFKGTAIAISLSKPADAIGWTTSKELIWGCTYFPIVLGAALIILSMMCSAVLFMHWLNKAE